jgi:hypothetical protein
MDQERARVQADLRGLLHCDVRCDDVTLQLYATDASIYELRPLAVVRPRSTLDVATWPGKRSVRVWSWISPTACARCWRSAPTA